MRHFDPEDRVKGGGSGVAAARVGRASGAGFSVYGGPAFDPRSPDVRLLVFTRPPSQYPRPGDCLRRDRLTPISIYFWLGFFSLHGG